MESLLGAGMQEYLCSFVLCCCHHCELLLWTSHRQLTCANSLWPASSSWEKIRFNLFLRWSQIFVLAYLYYIFLFILPEFASSYPLHLEPV